MYEQNFDIDLIKITRYFQIYDLFRSFWILIGIKNLHPVM